MSGDAEEDDDFSEVVLPEYVFDPKWSTALPDWEDRIKTGRSLIPDLPLDSQRADRALRLFKQMRMPDVRGRPTYGEACDEFIFDLVRAIFGAFDRETQARMIREYFLLIPKKNGKTSIAAAIKVLAMIMNERPDAELVLIAPTIKIARRSFKQACGIIQHTVLKSGVALSDLFTTHPSDRMIRYLSDETPSEMAILAADTDTVTGSKASYVLIDETHEFAKKPRSNEVFIELRGGLSHEDNTGFFLQITTQSKSAPSGVFKSELDLARGVRDGKQQYPMLAVLYELPLALSIDNGWKRRETWRMVNPHLGRSVNEAFLMQQLSKAEADGPEALSLLASQHFNVQIGLGLSADGWPGALFWKAAAVPGLTLDGILATCDVCVAGIDGGGLDDLAALAIIGRHKKTRAWLHWAKVWAHNDVFERRKSIASVLRDFESQGDLTVCADPDQWARECAEFCERVFLAGLFPEKYGIGLDAYGVAGLQDDLALRGMAGELVMSVGQGWKLQEAVLSLPLKLKSRAFQHCGSPLMDWSVGNAKTELKGSNYVVTKQAAGSAKIDPLMATFNAAMLMFRNPEASNGRSYLETHKMMVV